MRAYLLVPVFVLVAATAWAADLNGSCQVRFFASSTLHDFEGIGRCQPFAVDLDAGEKTASLEKPGAILVPVLSMDTDNRRRDRQMREMFDSEQYPQIRGTIPPFDPFRIAAHLASAPPQGALLEFELRIRDISHRVQARALNFQETAGEISFDLEFPLSLKQYQLEPPTILGFIRVDDRLQVRVALKLRKTQPELWLSGQ